MLPKHTHTKKNLQIYNGLPASQFNPWIFEFVTKLRLSLYKNEIIRVPSKLTNFSHIYVYNFLSVAWEKYPV